MTGSGLVALKLLVLARLGRLSKALMRKAKRDASTIAMVVDGAH